MRPFLLSGLAVSDWLAIGVPLRSPDSSNATPMGVVESWALIGLLGLACWGLFRLFIWLDIKVKTQRALLSDLDRELGIGPGSGRSGARRRRHA